MDRRRLTIAANYLCLLGMVACLLIAGTSKADPARMAAAAKGLLAGTLAFGACFVYYLLAVVPREERPPVVALSLSTLAFTISFMCWTLNGVLVTDLVDHGVLDLSKTQIGALLGIPILTGSITRLPVGILTDKYGGKVVYGCVMLLSAIPLFALSYANSYAAFWWLSLGFGLVGASFAVGIAYCSVWFPASRQGTALGIFGAGNAGSAITSMGAPALLKMFTQDYTNLEGWRRLPQLYAVILLLMAVAFFLCAPHRKVDDSRSNSLRDRLRPLRHMRVWRFGLYYFLVFGGFVALASWLVPYYVSVYGVSLLVAGNLTAIFSLPSGVIRAVGGWMSDQWGARAVMYWVLGVTLACCLVLIMPRMNVETPGNPVLATRPGTVTAVDAGGIRVGEQNYPLQAPPASLTDELHGAETGILASGVFWHEPVVTVGQQVKRKQLLAAGVTRLHFPASIILFTLLVFIVGVAMGIGKAAVYRHIPDYFPHEVGVVGGIVGVIGGLGGWAGPFIFGWLLEHTGLWTSCWVLFSGLTAACLVWMHLVITRMLRREAPHVAEHIDAGGPSAAPEGGR
ncbi:MAG: NarK/NasA family nitrate transporter [Fimbriimonadaceae bacterium]|nr:NarK/NasA family nitrate transporter [Fimbriimonadaceae bacterium]